ncbi:MAG: hypothetical protein KDK97_12485 [Verrucomicrobiales bacterium]|nr:hypothetical protein [Verrucomicrobiales bacterium]MCP5556167.1 hypothetical protein [Verrucomicrobiaceae bacterium]
MTTLTDLFDWLLGTSIRASLLALAVFLLQAALRRHLTARMRYVLWLPMLIVLLMPVFPQSRWSVATLLTESAPPQQIQATPAPIDYGPTTIAIESSPASPAATPIDWPRLFAIGWAIGAAGILLLGSLSFLVTLRRFKRSLQPVSDELRSTLAHIASEIGLRRVPRVWMGSTIYSPAVTGILRPTLLLPAHFDHAFTPAEAGLVLKHELMHLKRHDLPLNALLCVLLAMHWFNPLLWIAFFKARLDREAACDAQVLQNDGIDRRREYGHALLKVETAFCPRGLSLGFVGIFQRGAALRSRIQSIAHHHPTRPAMKLTILALTALLTFLGITRAATEPPAGPEIRLVARFIEIRGEKNDPTSPEASLKKLLADLTITDPAPGPIRAQLNDSDHQRLLRQLSAMKGVDLMAVPSMVTRSGQRASVQISREFLDAVNTPIDGPQIGVTLDVLPTLTRTGSMELAISSKIVEFDGFVDGPNAEKKPVFNERKGEAQTTVQPGQTVLLDIGARSDTQDVIEEDADGKVLSQHQDRYTRYAFVLVTAAVAKVEPEKTKPTEFSVGKSTFRQGDSIRIRQVQRGKDFMTVTADYELASTDSARVSLHLTSTTTASKGVKVHRSQSETVTRGKGSVTIHHPDVQEGLPHLTFYDTQSGRPIGGIYFGTLAEAEASQKLDLSYMLKDPASDHKTAAANPAMADEIILPEIEFHDVKLSAAIDFLRTKSQKLFPEKKAPKILIKPGGKQEARISLNLKQVPLSQALRYCAQLAGYELSHSDDVFTLTPITEKP